MIQGAFSFKSHGKFEPFSQRTDGSINLIYESLITVDYKYKEILLYAFLIFIQIHSFDVRKCRFLLVSILYSIQQGWKLLYIWDQQ